MKDYRRQIDRLAGKVPGHRPDPALDRELRRRIEELRRADPMAVTETDDGYIVHLDGDEVLRVRLPGIDLARQK